MSQTELDALVKRMAMTGALTWGGIHLEQERTWSDDNYWKIPAEDVDEWMNDPESNPARERAYRLAKRLLGIGDTDGMA